MQDEMNSLHENNTFELVKLPKGKRALKNKWVYKLKTEEHTSRPRYKARLVVKGFSQKRGIDFDEIFTSRGCEDMDQDSVDLVWRLQPRSLRWSKWMSRQLFSMASTETDGTKKFESVIRKARSYEKTLQNHCTIGRIAQLKRDLSKFNMDKATVVSSPLATNFKLTDKDCPSFKKNIEKMDRVSYASTVAMEAENMDMYRDICERADMIIRTLLIPNDHLSFNFEFLYILVDSASATEYIFKLSLILNDAFDMNLAEVAR
ncbi:putative RNA-directed DNA polymerase [Tanacetum coccineum]